MVKISVDVMGGDKGMDVTMPAVKAFLENNSEAHLLLVGDEAKIKEWSQKLSLDAGRFTIVHASQVVDMEEVPQHALKNKRDSSMRVAINQVKEGNATVTVSAGNTGALMATAKFVLKTLPGVHRPAIAKFLPSPKEGHHVLCLDLGANVDSPAENLVEFAIVGSHLYKVVSDEAAPKVGLLNVGSEEIKGTESVKSAFRMLKETNLNFKGNVEADEIFTGEYDVIVCDGFVGNILLKNIEGTIKFLGKMMKREYTSGILRKIAALVSLPVFNGMKNKFDPRKYNGALFLGLRGLVLKSHGGTDSLGFEYALHEACLYAKSNIMKKLEESVTPDLEKFTAYKDAMKNATEAGDAKDSKKEEEA